MSVLFVDLNEAKGNGLEIQPIKTMMNHGTTEIFIDDLKVPVENLIGEEGQGFRYILDGMNAERILIAAECIGDGRWFVEKATNYANERVVFNRPIGQNQGMQFPIARAYIHIEAADLMRFKAAELYDAGDPCGAEANMSKLLAADAYGRRLMLHCKLMVDLVLQLSMTLSVNLRRQGFIRLHRFLRI